MPLSCGFGTATITPPIGTPLGGYENRKFNALGIHDDLRARCMLFQDTETSMNVAIIICDLLWVHYEFTDCIKAIIEEITRGVVKKENIIISAIHTHSSQRIEGGLDFYYKPVKKKHDLDQGWYVSNALPYLQRNIASSVIGALQDLKPASIVYNSGTTDTGHNRRYGDDAASIVDRELLVAAFLKGGSELGGSNIRAIFYNLANHCVGMGEDNYLISADWPYFTAELLKADLKLDWSASIIFGQGTAGNTNPYNCIFNQEVREIRDCEEIGQRVASDVSKVLCAEGLKPLVTNGEPCSIAVKSKTIHVEVTDPAKIEFYRQFNLSFIGVVELDGTLQLEIRITIIKINNMVIISVPGEPFGEFGVEMRKIVRDRDPDFGPVILELTDGSIGYITTRDSYYNGKGYEASLAGSAETGYQMLEAIKEMVKYL
jgi:hypothetical protein